MKDNKPILDFLDSLGVRYRLISHSDVHTMADLEPIEMELEAPFFRNLFLCDRKKTTFYLLLIERDKPFRTAEVSKLLGVSRLSFCPEEILEDMLGVYSGAVNPLSLIFDTEKRIKLVADRAILGLPKVCLHPGSNSQSLVMETSDLFQKVLPQMGEIPVWIDVKGEV